MKMLQPRRFSGAILLMIVLAQCIAGDEEPLAFTRRRRQDADDVTTVLLVDNRGRPSFGRFLNVKPDLGLLTSTARTFIQEGVTTEYATQVLGTTLDNGRLYAHLLTKSSRVLYDNDLPTRSFNDFNNKKWNIDNNLINSRNFVKNTDFISPDKSDPYLVFPTSKPSPYRFVEKESLNKKIESKPDSKEEVLNSAPSNNARLPFEQDAISKESVSQSFSTWSAKNKQNTNIKVFQINPKPHDMKTDNFINHKGPEVKDSKRQAKEGEAVGLVPAKVRDWTELPTFTVRNEFSPSGVSYLGDFPDFDVNTERNKATTAAERKAKFLFRKPSKSELKELSTVTYSGFADFTTIVGDTVIIFTPFTSEQSKPNNGQVTSISGEATLRSFSEIKPTASIKEPIVATTIKNLFRPKITTEQSVEDFVTVPKMKTQFRPKTTTEESEPPEEEEEEKPVTTTGPISKIKNLFRPRTTTESGPIKIKNILRPKSSKEVNEERSMLPTMVIDASDRPRQSEENTEESYEDMAAKSSVLAHEQKISFELSPTPELDSSVISATEESTISFTPELIEPSESVTPLLSTPSDEDIAKILASLAAQNKQATEPLNSASTEDFEISSSTSIPEKDTQVLGGATTIFFDDDPFIQNTAIFEAPTTNRIEEKLTSNEPSTTELDATTDNLVTTEKLKETTENLLTTQHETTTQREPTTTRKVPITTQKDLLTTDQEDLTTAELPETTPEILSNELDGKDDTDVACTSGVQILPTTVYKTLTYLTTFFIPFEDTTTTSIKSHEVVSTEIGFETRPCTDDNEITPSTTDYSIRPSVETTSQTTERDITTQKTEKPTTLEVKEQTTPEIVESVTQLTSTSEGTTELEPTTDHLTTYDFAGETTPLEITTERRHVTESDSELTEMTTENGDEIEVIFKTLYTTYTYLTTYFQESTSSVASRKEVITNVITSTLDPSSEVTDPAVAGLFEREDSLVSGYKSKPPSFDDLIVPTSVGIGRPTTTYPGDSDNILDNELTKPTPALSDDISADGIKTYYTTYTYFTTIFVDGETEISSRTEVYTNFVTPTIGPNPMEEVTATAQPELVLAAEQVESPEEIDDFKPIYNTTISREKNKIDATKKAGPNYSTLQRSTTENAPIENDLVLNLNDYETISTMVTDVRSSTSQGDRRIIDNVDKRNALLDDQIVAESNNDSEIIPSPTLLLQTSYTTFTYFTTMYQGTTSSNVASRLETVTNVVTETLTPTRSLSVEDLNLPITYFTTFTYWTTLYKDGTTKITSREDTVSNIVTPSAITTTAPPTIDITPTVSTSKITPTSSVEEIQPTKANDDTTYYTTYTYYTTSYIGESTVLHSRLETVTNILNQSDVNQVARAIGAINQNQIEDDINTKSVTPNEVLPTGLLSTVVSTVENSGTRTIISIDVFGTYIDGLYAKVLESTSSILTESIEPTSTTQVTLKPTGVVSLNQGKIVDAEGVSTLFYTTKAVGTYIDNLYAQVIESTSSLKVNEEKKSAMTSTEPVVHKTGLVRLIEGSIVQNYTTTLYESKVIGTLIDGRYAQIIESTSSFIVEKTKAPAIAPSPASGIAPTPTKAPDETITSTALPISPSPVVIEGSLNDATKVDDDNTTEEDDEDEEDDSKETGSTSKRSRLTFQSRKRTFTPAIRPFASRPRPTFAPKRKGSGPSATTITRSDFTPTVTAIPASSKTRGFNRRGSSSSSSVVQPTSSGTRKFVRKSSSAVTTNPSSVGFGRGRTSSRIQPTVAVVGASSRRGGGRSSGQVRSTSLFSANARFGRIRPTPASSLNKSPNSNAVTPPSTDFNDEDNDLTTQLTDNPTGITDDDGETTLQLATTTEGSFRRSQNPLLKFRRPPITRTTSAPRGTTAARSGSRNGNRNGNRVSTTTAKPKSTFNRPAAAIQNRARPGNGLFPRRGLFTTTTTSAPAEEDEEEEFETEDDGEEDEDTDYEGSNTDTQTEQAPSTRRGRANANVSPVQIRPFVRFRQRSKRETTYSRFRRPSSVRTTAAPIKEEEPEPEIQKPTGRPSRFKPRNRSSGAYSTTPAPKRISPTRSSSNQGRAQFTLREKDTTTSRSNFRRPNSSSGRRTTSAPSRPKSPRLKSPQTESPSGYRKSSTTSRSSNNRNTRRGSQRSRTRSSTEPIDTNFVIPDFNDGTITITHSVPTEATIPVVNGKVTEYRNIVTARLITEILKPEQYSTSINPFGKEVTILLSESTGIGGNGLTEITQFVLNETPTTTVVFTPTYIRGRKTSFSHVVPSTAYGVDAVVNTIQPQLNPQAPLANILLSQLLLGNIGLPQQNPLLGIQGIQSTPSTPTTEFKTRTTTYVTTVTKSMSTVIPLTFRGKEILTTILDSSTEVVTATEFLTDTIVVTPTAAVGGGQNLNSLLLPLLLQQQQQQQTANPLLQQSPAGVFNLGQDGPFAQALYQDPLDDDNSSYSETEEYTEQVIADEVTKSPRRKTSRKKPKKPSTPPPRESSVITLYVSGRIPGEFSTILSTVFADENNKRKREVRPSIVKREIATSTQSYLDPYITPAISDGGIENIDGLFETESLESILGDVNKYVVTTTPDLFETKTTKNLKTKKLVDLEFAPLTPKVETLLLQTRGDLNTNWNENYVSNKLSFKFKEINTKIYVRNKREEIVEEAPHLPKLRVVKKLIRKQAINGTENRRAGKSLALEDSEINLPERLPRRRLVVKKRPIMISSSEPTKSLRRTLVVTRKKLLQTTTSSMVIPTIEINLLTEEKPNPNTQNTNSMLDDTTTEETTEEATTLMVLDEKLPKNISNVPDYEPFFPEITESFGDPVLLLKTTVISSSEFETKTVVQTRLRTYTFVVTRVNGNEQFVTSTTEVKPQTKTLTLTEPIVRYTTLTLLDLGATDSLPFVPLTVIPSMVSSTLHTDTKENEGRLFEEARYNLATRVMSNGVEVIVAGDKSTLPGEPDVLRVLPSSIYKPITLKPSTLSNHMMMLLPSDVSNAESLSSSLYPNEFVTKTCLTTFTYLTTYLENGTTTVSSHEQVVSNIATEERNTGKIIPTPSTGITLTQHPNLAVGVFLTTFTYLNTILDGEQPLVVTSRHTVTNTVTAPDDYLSLLQPSKKASAVRDTNTYYSTIALKKTLYEGSQSKVVSTNEVVTQVVITESVPPKATSVMTSYIALDVDPDPPLSEYSTTDVAKTYFVTYTYYDTIVENGHTVIHTNVSTSGDVVTEKIFLNPKRTVNKNVINTSPIKDKKKNKEPETFEIFATKTYQTVFTYFTTLQEKKHEGISTVISSHTRIVKNVITETIDPNLIDKKNLNSIRSEIKEGSNTILKVATFHNGQTIEVTAIKKDKIKPTSVLTITKTQMPEIKIDTTERNVESSNPNIITGSTIIFFDEHDQMDSKTTPSMSQKPNKIETTKNGLPALLSSEIVSTTSKSHSKRKSESSSVHTKAPNSNGNKKIKTMTTESPKKKAPSNKLVKPVVAVAETPDLLGLGSFNINSLTALKPVFNAMAGLIRTNLKSTKRNDTLPTPRPILSEPNITSRVPQAFDTQNRSPIYIPVVGDDIEVAESQNLPFYPNEQGDWGEETFKDQIVIGKPTHESPLLNGGIPISPGQVITANSDVIVGKPGRIKPRIPAIPLSHVQEDEAPLGMKPPPVQGENWTKRNVNRFNEKLSIPVRGEKVQDDYVGPPPPKVSVRPANINRGEKRKTVDHKHLVRGPAKTQPNHIPISFGHDNGPNKFNNENIENLIPPQIQFEPSIILATPQFNLQPSILPEVIERSTGQPLLVNLQPSQVAFVNIPHNRTTALIYGGSTEPHRNGQYFDDPSPYPEPEFSGIESFINGVPQIASVYQEVPQQPNQKQVGGVIKVGTQVIDVNPPSPDYSTPIHPSKPGNFHNIPISPNHGININVPPISFGMVHQGNNFDAHIINHGDIVFDPPSISYTVAKDTRPSESVHQDRKPPQQNTFIHFNNKANHPLSGEIWNLKPPNEVRPFRKPETNRPIPVRRPGYYLEEIENMVPPPIPLETVPIRNEIHSHDIRRPDDIRKPIPLIPATYHNVSHVSPSYKPDDYEDNDDIISEGGEVIQETNHRPLRPGQLPSEVLRINHTTTMERPSVVFPDNQEIPISSQENEVLFNTNYRPAIEDPRPFTARPIYQPNRHHPTTQRTLIQTKRTNPFTVYNPNPHIGQRRPPVTSLPVDVQEVVTHGPSINVYENSVTNRQIGSQTEKPFNGFYGVSNATERHPTIYNFGNKDSVTSETEIKFPAKVKPENGSYLHVGAVPVLTSTSKIESEMEILKPPAFDPNFGRPIRPSSVLPNRSTIRPPNRSPTNRPFVNRTRPIHPSEHPPRIEINSPNGGIQRVPNLNNRLRGPDLISQVNTQTPYVPQPVEEMVPPPLPPTTSEEVLGMSPPPITTHKSVISSKPNSSTHKPVFSLEIDVPENEVAESKRPNIRTTSRPLRRPFTRRPQSTTVGTTNRPPFSWGRPVTPIDFTAFGRSTKKPVVPPIEVNETKQLDVIVGHPNVDLNLAESSSEIHLSGKVSIHPEIIGSEVSIPEKDNLATDVISTTMRPNINETTSTKFVFTTGIHHGGNEIKISDDTTKEIHETTTKLSKTILPTRYITHTKTSTVTITKTTVVKTLGGSPSTMTILVTKTEKSTIVDTVTEFHTLVKPTSIVETITTTVNQPPSTLYPPDFPYGNYPNYPIEPTETVVTEIPQEEDDLEEFIIKETDPPFEDSDDPSDNDSIFVVMTDKKQGEVIPIPNVINNTSYETQNRDEMIATNDVNRVLLGGILIASPSNPETPQIRKDKCTPDCKASRNELCQKVEGIMRCVCRPGFARMFPDRPCKPTYTYSLKLNLERYGKEKLQFDEILGDSSTPEYSRLASATHEGLDRMVMQSDLRDIYHGVHVNGFEAAPEGVINNFNLQLSDNTDENRLKEVFKKYLRNNNYSLGGTEVYAYRGSLDNLDAKDFDECVSSQFHDCSEHAHCFNLPGTYTCSCREGFADLSENNLYPGRICSAELIGCEKCHYHGTCYSKGEDLVICECFHWYAGENCHINLKVLLIALVTIGAILFVLLLVCVILTCVKRKPRSSRATDGISFLPQRVGNRGRNTLDRRAMIPDNSSDGSQSDTNTLPYVPKKPTNKKPTKGALKKPSVDVENGDVTTFSDQKDRSLTVMIPRAKYHPAPPTSPLLNMQTFDKRKSSAASSNEAKLLSYLDAGPSPCKVDLKRKCSNTASDSFLSEKLSPRKISGGALVSAGFEVSATVVGHNMGTLGTIMTTGGTEADRSENATLIHKISADLLSSTGTRSQFTTLRKSIMDNDCDDPMTNWLDIPPRVNTTVSESRSYDETTIQAPMKSFRNGYGSKPSSQHHNDEANTMAERDIGSTFLLPHTHLYKPDRGSDISGFDSL